VTDVVTKAVENMAYQQGFKSLKFKNCNGVIYHDADWIAGVDYDDPDDIENEDEEYDNEEDESKDRLEQYEELEEQLEHIDPEEIEDIMRDARGETNPNMHEQHNKANEEQLEHPVEQQEVPAEPTRSSTRKPRPIERLEPKMSGKLYMQEQKKVNFECDAEQELKYHHNLITQNEPDEGQSKEYSPSDAMLMARLIHDLNTRVVREGASFAQQYLLNKGLKIFGQKGQDASKKEMDQLHRRSCFTPKSIAKMTQIERRRAQQALMFREKSKTEPLKGEWSTMESQPENGYQERTLRVQQQHLKALTAVIDAHEERDVMTCDIPNVFIQALMPEVKDGDERVMMKITGVLVDMLVELNPELYGPYVVFERNRQNKVLYVQVMRVIYGMLEDAILWYKKFRGELKQKGFKFNPYDPCVANRTEKRLQHTLLFHVDDLKSSHKDSKVNDQFD
jgi:hypothetical protein